ncbi:hypothetical protein N0B44_15520 [Roseibacterium beibuensis]|uniref:Rz1-like lysis system protein LysC n=1 Tax=[Roseibacterium] beibuensis TaxID=1193142 RepID=UPI00217D20F4|nr:hypothetical protein [Roseibacterium beibuensis]MCS6624328.1 hypothetical protein [Roseibacterium beibuensis]
MSACAGRNEPPPDLVTPEIPAPLLAPVPVPDRAVASVADAAALLTDYHLALEAANGRISAVGAILACWSALGQGADGCAEEE